MSFSLFARPLPRTQPEPEVFSSLFKYALADVIFESDGSEKAAQLERKAGE
jgi:hypothetical protein